MATMIDFKEWLSGVDLEDYNDVYCLYQAVNKLEEWGMFNCSMRETANRNMYFVKCDCVDEVLMLASDKARDYFLTYIEKTYVDDEMDIETWYNFKYLKEKDD